MVQAALKLVPEPIFGADFMAVSYGFRPRRRAHDAIAEVHMFGSRGFRWVLDADIEACFDRIDHSALMDRVRLRIKDKRVLALVKAFLKAGVLTEQAGLKDSDNRHATGRNPLASAGQHRAERARRACDGAVGPEGTMGTTYRRHHRRSNGLPTWRMFVMQTISSYSCTATEPTSTTYAKTSPVCLLRSVCACRPTKTRIVHMADGFDFLGFHIQWRRKRGTNQWYVYTLIAQQPRAR